MKDNSVSQAKHTPLPWALIPPEPANSWHFDTIVSRNHTRLAEVCDSGPKGKANATYIVKACNAFPELVSTLEACRAELAESGAAGSRAFDAACTLLVKLGSAR